MGGSSSLDLTAGFYKSRQTIDMDWLWSSYLLEAKGDNAALIDVRNGAGALQTDGGLVAYGASFFGGCCRRTYNLDFDTNAPYAALSYNAGKLTLDGSLRYDAGNARGYVAGDGPVVATDVDGNGVISIPETKTTIMPLGPCEMPDRRCARAVSIRRQGRLEDQFEATWMPIDLASVCVNSTG